MPVLTPKGLSKNKKKFQVLCSFELCFESKREKSALLLQFWRNNFSKNFFDNSNFGSFDFVSQGDNILKDTNSLRSRMINDLNIKSFNFISTRLKI